MNYRTIGMSLALIGVFAIGQDAISKDRELSDSTIRQRMITESIQSYPGSCPCPYNTARNGSSCGRRSAYSRPGGYAPLCYARDISKAQVEEYRRSGAATAH
jgi:hypothetical protein